MNSDIIFGIDFGTNNTVITYFKNNKANVLYDGVFKTIKTRVGTNACGNYVNANSDTIIQNFKTKIGSEDLNQTLIIFFSHLKKLIYSKFPDCSLKTVITVPSNFNDTQREIIKQNFINCGFNIIRIINEPTAAALAYGLQTSCDDEEKILVLDLGAGTLDISILLKENGFFEIIDSNGLNDLGGNDFTRVIYDYVLKHRQFDESKLNTLWYSCQNTKEKLSYLNEYDVKVNDYTFTISNNKFESLSQNLIDRFNEILTNIRDNHNDIKYIIMVGNSSKIPFIKTNIDKIFNKTPWIYPNVDTVVSEGACLYGAIIEKKYQSDFNVLLVDVLPLSLGVETADGNFSIIIPKNTPVPIKRTQRYTTDTPSDNSVTIKIYQGERIIANKNKLIGQFIFDQITVDCNPQIDITFKVDFNSIINVIVTDKKSGVEKNILIKNLDMIPPEEIDDIIKNAEINNNIDEEEMLKCSRIYQLNTKIEIAMNNIKTNNLFNDDKKNELLDDLKNIDSKIESANNTELLNLLNEMNDKYLHITNNIQNNDHQPEKNDLEKLMIFELKDQLNNKINELLNKNPEWNEYLHPILEHLTYTNVTLEYIQDKINILKELEDEEIISPKDELNNLCLFINNEIEQGIMELPQDKIIKLNILIADTFNKLNSNNKFDWQIELDNFNSICENINNE